MLDFQTFQSKNIFIDLAAEAHALLRGDTNQEVEGVSENVRKQGNISITEITILNEEGAKRMGRPIGHYYTAEAPSLFDDTTIFVPFSMEISSILKGLINTTGNILVCGLGNPHVTADSVGPKTIQGSMATRHLFRYMAEHMEEGFSNISLLSPNVMGNTGLESAEILKGVVKEAGADVLIAIDALAATSIERIGTSFQITDTGIVPGSGLGNQRYAIDEATIGIPVIAVGVPTVVHFSAIVHAVYDKIKSAGMLLQTSADAVIEDLTKDPLRYAVTPKDIDTVTDGAADVLMASLHMALHDAINENNFAEYLHLSGVLQ